MPRRRLRSIHVKAAPQAFALSIGILWSRLLAMDASRLLSATLLVVISLFLATAACSSGSSSPDLACASLCGVCASDEVCAAGTRIVAICLKTCSDSAQCQAGQRCSRLLDGSTDRSVFVCTSDQAPAACGAPGATTCTDLRPFCTDGTHLEQPFTSSSNYTCGFDLITCAGACKNVDTPSGMTGQCQ
jgi:hypothetical protein